MIYVIVYGTIVGGITIMWLIEVIRDIHNARKEVTLEYDPDDEIDITNELQQGMKE